MSRTPRDFAARPEAEQRALLSSTWCDRCGQADLGLIAPCEFEERGRIYVQGCCASCGASLCSEVVEDEGPARGER